MQSDYPQFDKLYTELSRPLLAHAYSFCKDWQISEDITQKTWLRVHRYISKKGETPDTPYVYRMNKDSAYDYFRKKEQFERKSGGVFVLNSISANQLWMLQYDENWNYGQPPYRRVSIARIDWMIQFLFEKACSGMSEVESLDAMVNELPFSTVWFPEEYEYGHGEYAGPNLLDVMDSTVSSPSTNDSMSTADTSVDMSGVSAIADQL